MVQSYQVEIVKDINMPLHEVVVRTEYFGQECINRYNYRSSGTPAAVSLSFGLVAAMGYLQSQLQVAFDVDTLAAAVQNMQKESVLYTDILARNVYDPQDFYTTPFQPNTVGTYIGPGEAMSPAFAYGFRSARSRLDIKRGFKRYVGVAENAVQPGGVVAENFLSTDALPVATALGDTIEYDDEGNTLTYEPVIVSKFAYTTPSGRTAYRYYEDTEGGEAEQMQNLANAGVWSAYTTIRTQVSRQYGRGR